MLRMTSLMTFVRAVLLFALLCPVVLQALPDPASASERVLYEDIQASRCGEKPKDTDSHHRFDSCCILCGVTAAKDLPASRIVVPESQPRLMAIRFAGLPDGRHFPADTLPANIHGPPA